jgi:hypothetical protein
MEPIDMAQRETFEHPYNRAEMIKWVNVYAD